MTDTDPDTRARAYAERMGERWEHMGPEGREAARLAVAVSAPAEQVDWRPAPPAPPAVDLVEIRRAVADYVWSEGCSCCRGDAHDLHKKRLAELLGVPPYDDGSGFDFQPFRTDADPVKAP